MSSYADPALWVIIVSWNSRDDVLGCLKQLAVQTCVHSAIVVDNGSMDGTAAAVRAQFPNVRLLALGHNAGFARAVNIAARYALERGADFLLLLNPDTTFADNLLARYLAAAAARPSAGVISSKIYLQVRPQYLWGIGGTITATTVRFVGMGVIDDGQYDQVRLDFVLGCGMLIRACVLRTIGLLDERFFVFFEEIDLCLRVRAAGWDVVLAPEVQMHHIGGNSTARRSYVRDFYIARSRMAFFRKHRRRFQLLALLRQEIEYTYWLLDDRRRHGAFRAIPYYLAGIGIGLFGKGRWLRLALS